MPFSRSQNRETLERLIKDVFEDDNEDGTPGPIRRALTNVASGVTDIGTLTAEEIENLSYKESDGTVIPLKKYEIGIVKTLKGYIFHRDSIGQSLRSMEDWDTCTLDTFNDFRVSTSWLVLSENGLQHAPSTLTDATTGQQPGGARTAGTHFRDPVYDFKRGIKRDISAYSDLKYDKGWDNWNRGLMAQARAQDLSEVLNPQYKPTDPIDKELFKEKQKFMYAVFEKHLQSDKGKALVRAYHNTSDAQSVYRDLCEYAVNSTKASMGSRDLLTYITSSRLGDGKWKGSTHAYILHWQDQLRKYQDLIDTKDHFSADVKRVMLENAVSQVPELRAVKVNADLARTQTGKHLTYNQYCALLSSAAQQYDDQFVQVSAKTTKATRHIYSHDVLGTPNEDAADYDIDHDVESLVQVNNMNFSRGPRLQRNQWDRLGNVSNDAQETWDLLPNEAKRIILEPRKPRERPIRQPTTDVNLHDISAHEFLQLYDHRTMEPSELTTEGGTEQTETSGNSGPDTTLLAHLTKQNPLPPGDIQRVLSSTMKRGRSDRTNGGKEPSTDPSDVITVNGKNYRLVNMTTITYSSGIHRQLRQGALVDRGANGGIAGEDVRVIDTTSRQVDVQGIDNHQIVDIPIVTAGAVVKTQRGDAIAIMHQYAYTGKGKTIHSSGQLEWFQQKVDERPIKTGGQQKITTIDGYVIPINIRSGLPYITMRPYTDNEWETLPHVVLTAPEEWIPSVLDHSLDEDEHWYDAVSDMDDIHSPFNEFGECRDMQIIHEHLMSPNDMDGHIIPTRALIAKDGP